MGYNKRMRLHCYKCHRPMRTCLCEEITPITTRERYVFLSHPREAYRRTSTGRLAHLALPNSKYIVAADVDSSKEFVNAIADDAYASYLVFPSEQAVEPGFAKESANKPLQLFLIEATWCMAKSMLKGSKLLQKLPALAFRPEYASRFRIRSQPRQECVSTIEAVGELMRVLEPTCTQEVQALLRPFDAMVERQIRFQKHYHPEHARKWE